MIDVTRKCDGCGEKIEPVDSSALSLSDITDECVKQVYTAGAMFLSCSVFAMGWIGDSQGRESRELGPKVKFEICTKCAENRTIASFKLKKPLF